MASDLRFWRRWDEQSAPFAFHCFTCRQSYEAATVEGLVEVSKAHVCRVIETPQGVLRIDNSVKLDVKTAERIRAAFAEGGPGRG